MKWKNFILILIVCVFFLVCPCFAESQQTNDEAALPEKVEIYFFHDTVCGSCDGTEEFFNIADDQLTGYKKYPLEIKAANIYLSDGKRQFDSIVNKMGLDKESLSLPLMIVGGRVFSGLDTIEKNIREAYLVAGEDLFVNKTVYNPKYKKTGSELFDGYSVNASNATVVYFYRIVCDECIKTAGVIDTLPGFVMQNKKQVPIDLIRINTRSGNNFERITAFFDAYNVPDKERTVPIVFFAGGYLSGYDNIASLLIPQLEAGIGQGFEFPIVKE